MAFVNERLTVQQRADFKERQIKKPSSGNIACPIFRTVDTEKEMCLWHLGILGRDDFSEHAFLFEWKGNEYVVIMEYSDPDPNSNLIKWSISKYETEFNGKEDFAGDFEDALRIFAIDGSDLQRNETIVDIDFRRVLK